MKFYSEKLDQLFDTQEALLDAEQATKSKTKKSKKSEADNAEVTPEVPTKKQLAAEVDAAEEEVREAYSNYEAAKVKAEELAKAYIEEHNKIMSPAENAVKEAEKKRYEAIRKFNDSFGAYQVTYTGAKAADEMMKAISGINSRANKLFRDMFWL